MREIITLAVGQAGNQISQKFWETISSEHGIDPSDGVYKGDNDYQFQKLDVFFTEAQGGRFVPRTVLIDLEPGVHNAIMSNKATGTLFSPDSFVNAQNGAGNNWAKGFFNEGSEIIEDVLDQVRKGTELCDSISAFQIMHSIGGGTGSGFGSLLLEKLTEEYSDQLCMNFSVMPGSIYGGNSDVVIEPYNSILTLNNLIENSSGVFQIENGAMNRICQQNLKMKEFEF